MGKQQEHFARWKDREEQAEAMIPMIGQLYREKNVIVTVYRRALINKSSINILHIHRSMLEIAETTLSVTDTFPILEALIDLDIHAARVDIGQLAVKYHEEGNGEDVRAFVAKEVAEIVGVAEPLTEPQDIVLYGFGRIGRLLARLLIEKTGSGNRLRLKAIVVRKGGKNDLQKRANLLKTDSVHGPFEGTMEVDEEGQAIIANGNYIPVIYASHPNEIDYTEYGIKNAIIVDNTGIRKDTAALSELLESKGASRVLLTAPGNDMKNVVYGINNDQVTDADTILCAASCTTNAIVPPLKAINDQFGLEFGHVETVHSYTNDQNLIDNYHKADRRGRSAPLNMVITSTGAAKAAAKVLPVLEGKLTGNAIRVPTPNVSMAILNLTLKKETSKDELNEYLKQLSLNSPLESQIGYVNSPDAVSSDFVGSRHACVIDSQATIVNGRHCVLYVWYDNEFGYSCQVLRLVQQMAGMNFPAFPH